MLDGPDGAGKTTQVARLAARLQEAGVEVLSLREPGATKAGEAIRAILLDRAQKKLTPLAETFLFQAARAQLIEEVIRPALAEGKWVLCDRFTLSTLIYQGYAGDVDKAAIETLSTLATQGLKPDLYMVLYVSSATGVSRRDARAADRMESKGNDFLIKVSEGYRSCASAPGSDYLLIDGEGSVEEVQEKIWQQMEPLIRPGNA